MPGNDRHDRTEDLDRWLGQQITPLPPPTGTFELIKRRARNRKVRKLGVTLTAAAAVAVAAVFIPRVTQLHITGPSSTGAVAGNNGPSSANPSGQPEGSATRESPTPIPLTPVSTEPPVPSNFQPSSVTFIGLHTGWVIGQAGTPGHCATQYCTSIARTDNAGQTWYGVRAPVTGSPDGSAGVSQIRFLDDLDGWAFGPELWSTHDGGQTWTQIPTNGKRVIALETAGARAFGIFATCSGTGQDFAANCTGFTLGSSPAGSDDWTPVGAATTNLTGSAAAAELDLTSTTGFLLAPDGTVYSGPLTGAWTKVGTAPCAPDSHLFGVQNATTAVLACPPDHTIYTSSDGGATWQPNATYPSSVTATGIAVSPSGAAILASTDGILYYSGGSWQQATLAGTTSRISFGYIGMTTSEQGIALVSSATSYDVWVTRNGGTTWEALPVSG